jgi:hypothetical protein|tara:strand:- start:326 stop:529 length:204 start_codon:yes stop_codon:yes gene_type:complete
VKNIKVIGRWSKEFVVKDIPTAVKKAQEIADLLENLDMEITGLQFIEPNTSRYDDFDTEFEEVGEEE